MIETSKDIKNIMYEVTGKAYAGNIEPPNFTWYIDKNTEDTEDKLFIKQRIVPAVGRAYSFQDECYCPKCKDKRRMVAEFRNDNMGRIYNSIRASENSVYEKHFIGVNTDLKKSDLEKLLKKYNDEYLELLDKKIDELLDGVLIQFQCLQCAETLWLVLYKTNEGLQIMFLSRNSYSIATEHTPEQVAFYLDQAHKAKSVGANSAAVTMYRAALEQLLHDKGYNDEVVKQKGFKNGMLGNKINALEKDINDGTQPKWANDIDLSILTIIKKLGNGAIHTNDGDIKKQALLDNEIIEILDILFEEILDIAYERDIVKQNRIAKINAVAKSL